MMTTCDRCGADLTYPKYVDKIIDALFSFTIDHTPPYATPGRFHKGAKIDLCMDCYKELRKFFENEEE